jgi:hypothetical protein
MNKILSLFVMEMEIVQEHLKKLVKEIFLLPQKLENFLFPLL